eukprot:4948348-Alexandrium_andersonii.AAC.1
MALEADLEQVWLGDVLGQVPAEGGGHVRGPAPAEGGSGGQDITNDYGRQNSAIGYNPIAGHSSSGHSGSVSGSDGHGSSGAAPAEGGWR